MNRNHKVFHRMGPLMIVDLLTKNGSTEAAEVAS
jgi:hypothetical protein